MQYSKSAQTMRTWATWAYPILIKVIFIIPVNSFISLAVTVFI